MTTQELRKMPERTQCKPSRKATARVKNPLPVPTICPYCNGPVALVSNAQIYGHEYGKWPWAYRCTQCDAYVGLHSHTTIPLGTLADLPTRDARRRAKAMFNNIWTRGDMTRSDAYVWLAKELGIEVGECHIGWFDVTQCLRVIEVCYGMIVARGLKLREDTKLDGEATR